MTLKTRFGIAVMTFCLPAVAMAVAPGSVTGIKAEMKDGKVAVSWTAVTDQKIASYHIYYSHQSILKNGGQYDDYQTADGDATSATLDRVPPVATLFVSILAANDAGEESAYFAEETSVDIASVQTTSNQPTSTATIPPAPTLVTDATDTDPMTIAATSSTPAKVTGEPASLKLLSAESVSATGVLLTFSDTVTVDNAKATKAFIIKTGSGKELTLTRLVITGKTVLLNTLPQERGVVYVVTVGDGITGTDPYGNEVPMDSAQAPMLFTGNKDGTAPDTQDTPWQPTMPEIRALRLTKESEGNNLFTVTAEWNVPSDARVAGLSISQSADGGNEWSTPSLVSKTVASVRIPHVPAGTFGILIKVRASDGSTSSGVRQSITLKGTVPKGDGTSGHLPNSGSSTLFALLLTSSILGWKFFSKRKLVNG